MVQLDPPDNRRGAPVLVLGVSRSGTTLLKEMLDQHPCLAIPPESYFIPQLWDRHGERPDPQRFASDIGRLARVREWGVTPADVRERISDQPVFADAIQAVYRAYADRRGKPRFGDKTPAYMQRLDVLERAFPGAHYVHLVRDGRDAGLSFIEMRRRPRFNWSRPRGLAAFAAQWRREVEGARRFGRERAAGRYHELRYEDLLADPELTLRQVCGFLGLEFDPEMLRYHRSQGARALPDHPRLMQPPTSGRRWQEQMAPDDAECFEAIAGELMAELGYERAHPEPSTTVRARALLQRALLEARIALWHIALALVRRSPIWRLRQVYIQRTFREGSTP
jgi:Sulfotransferase family